MVYECDQCNAALPAGVHACPHCGENFEDAVPADAVLPASGFHAADMPPEADVALLKEQALVLKSEVMTLRGLVTTLTGEVTALEEQTASQTSQITLLTQTLAGMESHVATLTNRLTVAEMAGREDKRRFIDHVKHMKEALGYIQISGPPGAAGQ